MLPRIFTGTILSIGCILTVQTAEVAFDKALEEFDTAFAAPADTAAELQASGGCDVPDDQPCGQGTLFAGELPPDIGAYVDCLESKDGKA